MVRPDFALRLPLLLWVLAGFGVVAALCGFGAAWIGQTVGLYELGAGPKPYFVPERALLLYLLTPLATLAAAMMFMAPGLMLAAAVGRQKGLAFWLIAGFGFSVAAITLATTVLQAATGNVLKGWDFWLLVVSVGMIAFGALAARVLGGGGIALRPGKDREDIAVALMLFLGCLILLSPKFYWENFTGDGHGALQFARLFIHRLWPFWPPEAGVIAQAPNLSMVLFIAPESWFVRLWGETEFAVRAPYLLYLALLYPVLAGLIRTGRTALLRLPDHLLIAGALAVYTVTIIYSGGYNPYFGDSPMPAARETLAIAMFFGFVLALAENRFAMMLATGVMAAITIPTGGLWLGLVALATWVVWPKTPQMGSAQSERGQRVRRAFVVIGLVLIIGGVVPKLGGLFGLPYPDDGEFGPRAIINRLRYVVLTDWQRLMFVIVPCGIVPILAMFTWRRQDAVARVLVLASVVFFVFFYVQGYRVLLHHFAPVMLVPLVVFWRSPLLEAGPLAVPLRPVAGLGIIAALWLAWPQEMKMHGHDRAIGQLVETSGPVFGTSTPDSAAGDRFRGFDPRALNVAHHLLGKLFPIGFKNADPKERFFGAPLVWWYYSEFPKPAGQKINYRVKPLADATPADGTLFEQFEGYGVYIADEALYAQNRGMIVPTDTGAQIFVVPRERMFGGGAQSGPMRVFDLVQVARGLIGR